MSTDAKVKKMNWAEKVIALLKGGEEAHVIKFQTELIKAWRKQVTNRERDIATAERQLKEFLEEKATEVEEANEELEGTLLSVDVTRIKTLDDRKDYYEDFTNKVNTVRKKIKLLNSDVEQREASTAKTIETKKKEIATYELNTKGLA